ncbi:hypothetical protein BpHYR1_027173 [Brachionus plicatilis]|uniref:Uncharacterized protein n=1 Tax=Brachionus plicatilis TaxID=10195 RepID=A0A3M7QQI2_BRAPC|nr:hypothetical protein BpHYR1_027173 [Brachionus plicatilis]
MNIKVEMKLKKKKYSYCRRSDSKKIYGMNTLSLNKGVRNICKLANNNSILPFLFILPQKKIKKQIKKKIYDIDL